MTDQQDTGLINVLKSSEILKGWMHEQLAATTLRKDLLDEKQLNQQSNEFLDLLRKVSQNEDLSNIEAPIFDAMRKFLSDLSQSRAIQGFSPTETATFVFSLKQPLFAQLAQLAGMTDNTLLKTMWTITSLLDKLGLYTAEQFQISREAIISRQQQEMLELSTPVAKLWEGILVLPLIGTLDSMRTQQVMENLLQKIVETSASVAIIDITGIPMVDTLVAQHLIKAVNAARLMGSECIVSGIRPQIAQTIVHLGISLHEVVTKATLADAVSFALKRVGYKVSRHD
jgi:rsbT co-antagonist protein RsbR